MIPFDRKHVVSGPTSFDLAADAQRFTYYNRPFDLQTGKFSELGTFTTFDIPEMKRFPAPDVRVVRDAKYALSPDGELLAIVGSDIPPVDGVWSQESRANFRKIQICSVATGKLIKTLETGSIQAMVWSPDSTSLVVSKTKSLNEEPDSWYQAVYLAKQTLEIYDTDKDGKLSIEEVKPSREILVDKNKDGFVDRKEIEKSLADRWSDKLAKLMLEFYDIDKDRKLSIEEVKASREILVDNSKDGFVDRQEIEKSLFDRLTNKLSKPTLKIYDTDKDGKLSIEEAKFSRSVLLVDKNKDGFVDRDEIAESRAYTYRRGRTRPPTFNELETRIYNVSSGDHILLQANATSDESSEKDELCFQRGMGSQFANRFVAPVIYENRIVLPLFVASTFRNGSRSYSTRKNRVDYKDMLGFFDIKTGKLTETTELKCEFKGSRFEVAKDLITTRVSSRERNSKLDSFIVFDRRNNNEGYLPVTQNYQPQSTPLAGRLERAQKSKRMSKGTPHLSPKHPLVAVSGSNRLEIWKLDSDNRSFGAIKTIRVSNKIKSLTWHPTKPIVAWIAAGIVHSYNADSGESDSFDSVRAAERIAATADGWLIFGFNRVNLLDDNLAVRKTILSTERFENYENAGTFDQCISADGTISNKAREANLRVVQLRENRIETRGVEVLTTDSSGQ